MSRQIPTDKVLSDDDRAYLLMRGEDARVEWFDQTYPAVAEEEGPEDEYDSWTVAELNAEIDRLNEDGAEIAPANTRKPALIAALRAYNAAEDDD